MLPLLLVALLAGCTTSPPPRAVTAAHVHDAATTTTHALADRALTIVIDTGVEDVAPFAGVRLSPTLVATSLTAQRHEHAFAITHLVDGGERGRRVANHVSGNPGDLDVAIMREEADGPTAPVAPTIDLPLCTERDADQLVAVGEGGALKSVRIKGAAAGTDYMLTLAPPLPEGVLPGAPVFAADCLFGIYTPPRLVHADAITYLLSTLQ